MDHGTPSAEPGYREPGGGVVKTFYDGYGQICVEDWDLLVKLDADRVSILITSSAAFSNSNGTRN